jgi:hypothetical protein
MRALQGLIQIYVDHFGSFPDRGSRPRWSSHRLGPSPGDHSRVTDSRNQADPRGHERTLRSSSSSTGVHQRTRRGTHGYAMSAVLDREAQVQIPGPQPKLNSKSAISRVLWRRRIRAAAQILVKLPQRKVSGGEVARHQTEAAADASLRVIGGTGRHPAGKNPTTRACTTSARFTSAQGCTSARRTLLPQ